MKKPKPTRMVPLATIMIPLLTTAAGFLAVDAALGAQAARIDFQRDDDGGRMTVLIDGNEALVYCCGKDLDLPHYFPVRSPSGKSLTVQRTEPYPHHRSFWFADKVELAGRRAVSFYAALYSQVDRSDPESPFRDHVRHVEFLPGTSTENQAEIAMKLLWEMDHTVPVLDELRRMRVAALGQGEYFLDITFTVTASYGDVKFVSDWAHYAWPYVRMSPEFSVQQGGTMTSSEGGVNQAQTNGKPARWVDYSSTVAGVTEGLAIFSHSDNEHPHGWLTRDYGTFGPRRNDARSGKPFVLKKGDSLTQRVGILVHKGDVGSGHVADRYQKYIMGELGGPLK